LEAFNRLENKNAGLHIYGGSSEGNTGTGIHHQGVQNQSVHYCGPYDNQTVGEKMAEIDVLVVPSTWRETGPLVLLEGLAAGRVVVASNLGGMAELVRPGRDGLLFKAGDSGDLLSCMRTLSENPAMLDDFSPDLRERYNIDNNHKEIVAIYEKVVVA